MYGLLRYSVLTGWDWTGSFHAREPPIVIIKLLYVYCYRQLQCCASGTQYRLHKTPY